MKDLVVACLQADKNEMQRLDLYINVSQQVTLKVQGAPELHLSGYFEPQSSEGDDQMFFDEDEDDVDEEDVKGGADKLN